MITLALIAKYGVACGVGYGGISWATIDALTMERMTICNMSIEFGSKMGIMNPDQSTYDYLKDGNVFQKLSKRRC